MKSIIILLALTACVNPTAQAPTIAEKDAPSKLRSSANKSQANV